MGDQLLTDLFAAYYDARRHKRNSANALDFEINYEQKLFELHKELKNGEYRLSRSVAFVTFNPVQREIIASPFRDRVIHHLIFNYINPIFEAGFINDSYSCRQGRGTSYGISRVSHFIRSCSDNYHQDCYVLKLDLSGYFMSIRHQELYDKISRRLLRLKNCSFDLDLVLRLVKKVIFHNYTAGCIFGCDRRKWRGLPANKSLFHAPAGVGLPIGNLTSQLFSNIYLNDFDHFMKRKMGLEYYGRYVDDFIVVDQDKEKLKAIITEVRKRLSASGLKLHPRKIYLQSYKKGIDFLGTVIKPRRIYIRNRTKNNFYRAIAEVNADFKTGDYKRKLLKIIAGVNSYLGLLGRYQTYSLRRQALLHRLNPLFWKFFYLGYGNDIYCKVILRKRYGNLICCQGLERILY